MYRQDMNTPTSLLQRLAVFPLLASIVMMFCSGSLLMVTPQGHHEDLPNDVGERVLLFVVAVSAPATVYLSQVIGPESVVLVGALLTFLGLLLVTLLEAPLTAVVTVAALHGAGIALMFTASVVALGSQYLRSNVCLPIAILGGSAIVMATTQDVAEMAFASLGNHLTLTLMAGCVVLLSACPALCLILDKRSHQECHQALAPGHQALAPGHQALAPGHQALAPGHRTLAPGHRALAPGHQALAPAGGDSMPRGHGGDLRCVSMVTENCVITTGVAETRREDKNMAPTHLKWRTCVMIWWGIGVDLALVTRLHFPVDYKVPTLMCAVSFLTLGERLVRGRGGSSASRHNTSPCTPFLPFGLLGISGVLICVPSLHKDVLHHCLVFTAGFFLQFGQILGVDTLTNGSQISPKGQQGKADDDGSQAVFCEKNSEILNGKEACPGNRVWSLKVLMTQLSDLNWIVNDVCVEMVLAFCALALGGLLAYPLSHLLYVMEFSSVFLSKTSLMVLSSTAVFLSLLRP
ncbi:unnamed protein product [Lymnaea stagnalis]|uniref:Uncharacterized protein n=1 Tax=Lymnaea stagnalis TaxID=6523 RepID=A0AAV2IKM7_LYMST